MVWAVVGLVLIMVLAACGGRDGEKGTVAAAERLLPEPLASTGVSPLLGAALPKGAEPEPSTSTSESFKVAPPVTLSEINAFYQREMDKKPFGNLAWCGSEVDEMAKTVTRYWGSPATGPHRAIVLSAINVTQPTLIVVSQLPGSVPTQCQAL